MGKKAKAKKARRAEKAKKTVKKQKVQKKPLLEKIIEKTKDKKKIASKVSKKQIYGGLLTAIMLTLLFFIGRYLYLTALKPQPVAHLLPAEGVVVLTEINTNLNHNQLRQGLTHLEGHEKYSETQLIEFLESKTTLTYESEIKPWLGRQAAVALLNTDEALRPVNFIEVISKKAATDTLVAKGATAKAYKDYQIHTLPGEAPLHFTFLKSYLVFSAHEQSIQHLIDARGTRTLALSDKYREATRSMPFQKLGFIYFDLDQVDNRVFQYFPFLGEMGLTMEIAQPFTALFDAEAMALTANENNFALDSFMSYDEELLNNISPITKKENYKARLANYIQPDTILFWGGANMENQLKRLIEVLAGGNETTLVVFDTILDNYTERYFGPDTSFSRDLLPLLEEEFAFAIEKIGDKRSYKVLIEDVKALKIHELANNFASTGAIFEPKVVDYILEDGTRSQEIVAVPEEITKAESMYKDRIIYELKLGSKEKGIYYTVVDDLAIITTTLEGLQKTLDLTSETSLRNTELFRTNIAPLLSVSDEISYFNVEELAPELSILSSISSGRDYDKNGISTLNYINIRQ